MPYTPPSQRSPASTAPTSPTVSQRPSLAKQTCGLKTSLSQTASYLTKHRRAPSTPVYKVGMSDDNGAPGLVQEAKEVATSPSIRQSPPARTENRAIPSGAIMSPPESPTLSDDDETLVMRSRRIENLKELQDAISQIPQHRQSSPEGKMARDSNDEAWPSAESSPPARGHQKSFSSSMLDQLPNSGRKFLLARSATESDIVMPRSTDSSLNDSEEELESELIRKPPMVRKKSGELVRPALRPASNQRRPSSMPGTPTFSKAVHFDSHLEHVRHFLQVDRPLAVSVGPSPVDEYESDEEYPFPKYNHSASRGASSHKLETVLANFPPETTARRACPVRVERVCLSSDQKALIGTVIVANLAFQKHVTCRFTLDYWKTTSEITADYMSKVQPQEGPQGHDRFSFSIKLSDLNNLDSKTLYFCVRYSVNGREFWDNNYNTNYQVDFRKASPTQSVVKPASSARPASPVKPSNGLPRNSGGSRARCISRSSSTPNSVASFQPPPPVSKAGPTQLDRSKNDAAVLPVKGGSTVSSSSLRLDCGNPGRLPALTSNTFGNRYDFSASFKASKESSKTDGQGGMKPSGRAPAAGQVVSKTPIAADRSVVRVPGATTAAKAPVPNKGEANHSSPSIASSSYEDLVNKYCFFGSRKQSPLQPMHAAEVPRHSTSSTAAGATVAMSQSANDRTGFTQDPSPAKLVLPQFEHSNLRNWRFTHSKSPVVVQVDNRTSNPSSDDHWLVLAPTSSAGRMPPPTNISEDFPSLVSTSPKAYAYQDLHDRFPFSHPETQAATAIWG